MPGICGIVRWKERNQRDLEIMIDSMRHEAFYVAGSYLDNQLGIAVGWALHKGSFSDCMPVWNEKKDIVMIFFGENFADKELFDRLKGANHQFERSNASCLVHLYEEKGEDFLVDLNGWFCGILIDLKQKKAILFNDRYGMQRIYYYEGREAFYFASEAKSLLNVIPESRNIDVRGLGEFFCSGCVLENRSLFKDIFLLPGGSAWIIKQDPGIRKSQYFSPDVWENQPKWGPDFFYSKLNETLSRIVPRYFKSGEKIGMSLTGGFDTRIIMARIQSEHGTMPCYTFNGIYRENFDVKIARKVAKMCHQPFHVITLDNDFLSMFPHYAEKTVYISDGTLDISGSPELYINKLARNIAPIRMTGDYGSEVLKSSLFLGSNLPKEEMLHADFKGHIENARKTYKNVLHGHPLTFTLFKDAPWVGYGRLSVEQSQVTLRTPYMDNDLVKVMYRALQGWRTNREISIRLIKESNPALGTIPTDRGVGGCSNHLFQMISHAYSEFLFKGEYAFNYGMPQWLSRVDHSLEWMHLDRIFLGRHKFAHFRPWFRNELSDYIRDVLLDERTLSRPYLNRRFIQQMVQSHTKGYGNYTKQIIQVLTAELIHRVLIEKT